MTTDIYAHLTEEDYANEEWRLIEPNSNYMASSLGRVLSLNYNQQGFKKY